MSAGEPIDLVEEELRAKMAAANLHSSEAYEAIRPLLAAAGINPDVFIEHLKTVLGPTLAVLVEAIEWHIAARRTYLEAKVKLEGAKATTEEARRIYLEAHAKTENPGALVVPFPRGGRPS